MRLLYVTAGLPYGPGEAFVIPELTELARAGHDLRIVPTYGRGAVVHDDARPLEEITDEPRLWSRAILREAAIAVGSAPLQSVRSVSCIVRSRSPRILVKNLAVVPKALWLSRVLGRHETEHVHVHWGGASSTLAMLAAEARGIPWSLTLHRWDITENNLLPLKVARACFVRTINQAGLEEARQLAGDHGGKLILLHVGVRTENEIEAGQARPQTRNGARLVMAANFVAVKGHNRLLESAALLDRRGIDYHLDLIGQGPLREAAAEQAKRLGIASRVTFLGQLSHSELLRRLSRHEWDALLLSSVETPAGEREGIPVVLMEAMASGVPVVASRIGGIPELLGGGAGILVEPDDPSALANAVEALLNDDGVRRETAQRGRRRVAESFAVERVVASLAAHFERCRAGQLRPPRPLRGP